jgi:hypothetical protein
MHLIDEVVVVRPIERELRRTVGVIARGCGQWLDAHQQYYQQSIIVAGG